MTVDPRLEKIDDSLYRVAVRAIIIQDNKVLLVKEHVADGWWAIPGGGIDYGETLSSSFTREIEEELGVSAEHISSDFKIIYHTIGKIVNGVPRMNVYFKASILKEHIKKTAHVQQYAWFSKKEFLESNLNASYDKTELATVIFI